MWLNFLSQQSCYNLTLFKQFNCLKIFLRLRYISLAVTSCHYTVMILQRLSYNIDNIMSALQVYCSQLRYDTFSKHTFNTCRKLSLDFDNCHTSMFNWNYNFHTAAIWIHCIKNQQSLIQLSFNSSISI